MKKFDLYPSDYGVSLPISIFLLPFAIIYFPFITSMIKINYQIVIAIVLIFIALVYIYISYFNSEIAITEEKIIRFERKLWPNKRSIDLELNKIEQMIFRSENPVLAYHKWCKKFFRKFLPYNHKWIKIKLKNGHKIKVYCYGLEYDYYDNLNPTIEQLFYKLKNLGVPVTWTLDSDSYFNNKN